uniref:Uncharacterized protein n=1 Tax=Populus trichocarpa TaxID=3694 RepID=A9PD42_POPTR|nr:unknown [Populus trichocarpa]
MHQHQAQHLMPPSLFPHSWHRLLLLLLGSSFEPPNFNSLDALPCFFLISFPTHLSFSLSDYISLLFGNLGSFTLQHGRDKGKRERKWVGIFLLLILYLFMYC